MQKIIFNEYVGDGIMLTLTNAIDSKGLIFGIATGTPSTNPLVHKGFAVGQFRSPVAKADAEIGLILNMADIDGSDRAGLSFRMQDSLNKYTVETDGSTVYLARYINGSRSVLAQQAYPLVKGTDYAIKVKAQGSTMNVWFNGIPMFSNVSDSAFSSGTFGMYSNRSFVNFKGLYAKDLDPGNSTDWLTNYAIWDAGTARADVRYDNITWTDPENDPIAGSYKWKYVQTPKFF